MWGDKINGKPYSTVFRYIALGNSDGYSKGETVWCYETHPESTWMVFKPFPHGVSKLIDGRFENGEHREIPENTPSTGARRCAERTAWDGIKPHPKAARTDPSTCRARCSDN